MTDPSLVAAVQEAANSANISRSHMASIMASFLLDRAKTRGSIGSTILRGLAEELMDDN